MKNYILAISMAALLFSCDTKEKEHLQSKVDSLNNALVESKKTEVTMNEVGVMLDSIDANRNVLRSKIVEGISYADYISRLQEINKHLKRSQEKLASLEKELKSSRSGSSATIHRLKSDLEARSKEIVSLQMDIITMRDQNKVLQAQLHQKDSILLGRDEEVKMKSASVATLESLVKDINDQNRIKVAGLYYAQAQALETAANRTKFAPRKKKETRKEALELYRLSFSMGNTEAEARIKELEKKLS
jgi:chromosome segregation ATPase